MLPRGAHVRGAVTPSAPVTVDVSLSPRDPAALDSFVQAVSEKGSPDYHHYLAKGRFASVFGPAPSTIAATRAWLAASGLRVGPTSPDGLLVPASGSAATVESAFATGLVDVQLPSGRVARANTVAPAVPAALAASVTSVVGLSTVAAPTSQATVPKQGHAAPAPSPKAAAPSPRVGPTPCTSAQITASDFGAYTADELAGAYGFTPLYAAGHTGAGVTIGILELEPYLNSDIATYMACYGLSNPLTDVAVDGGAGTGAGSGEAALDIEDAMGLAPGAAIRVYSGPQVGNGVLDTYDRMVTDDVAKVISTSWGLCEAAMPVGDAVSEDTIFTAAAAQGQTVFAAAGDEGSEDCYTGAPGTSFLAVDDPADQPYVTGVGGTTLASLPPSSSSEYVWNDGAGPNGGAGGGGISGRFTMPWWQSGPGVTNSFTSSSTCPVSSGPGTVSCRQVPDVTALADPFDGYVVYLSGFWDSIGGTSAGAAAVDARSPPTSTRPSAPRSGCSTRRCTRRRRAAPRRSTTSSRATTTCWGQQRRLPGDHRLRHGLGPRQPERGGPPFQPPVVVSHRQFGVAGGRPADRRLRRDRARLRLHRGHLGHRRRGGGHLVPRRLGQSAVGHRPGGRRRRRRHRGDHAARHEHRQRR